MQRLQTLQPEIKKIQERYKDDKQRMNQEVMAFYQREKVNPLGSCLPLLLQIPFFISLFYLLRSDEFQADIAEQPGLLSDRQPRREGHRTRCCSASLIVLYVGTQLAASAVTAISADPMQRRIMFALPFVFVIFIINFEAGLIVYWITTNVWTIGQQLLVQEALSEAGARARPSADDGGDAAAGAREAAKPAAAAAARERRTVASRRRQSRRREGQGARQPARRQRRAGQGAAALAAQEEEALRAPALSGRRCP